MANEINDRIKKYRKERKLTQAELAAKIGVKTSTYSQMEREGNIKVDMALKIAEALNVDPNLIVYGKSITPDEELIFSPGKPDEYVFKTSGNIAEKLYGPTSQPEEKNDEIDLPFTLSNTEKNVITAYHYLTKPQQKEVRVFIDDVRKRGR